MKTLIWTVAILAGSSLAAAAQQSNVFVAVGSNGVEVRRPDGSLLTTLSGAPYNFSGPYDIVYSSAFDTVAVSNDTSRTVTLFNATSFAHIATLPLANAISARGMSVSGNGRFVYVAAQRLVGPAAFAAVFQIDLADSTPTLAGEIGVPVGDNVEDCVVVNSSAVGGTGGSNPGRVYFTVPNGDFLGIININPSGPIGSLDVAQAPVVNINTPTQLERTPDHSVVFIGVTTNDGTPVQRIGRIAVNGDVLTQPVVRGSSMSLAHEVIDIAFRPDGRGYINNIIDAGTPSIIEIDDTGASLGLVSVAASVPAAARIRYDATPERLYIGENSGTSNQFGIKNASTQPVGATSIVLAGAGGPRAFAFAQAAAGPVISDVSPSGMVSAPGTVIEISGSGFAPASVVEFYNQAGIPTARTETFVNSGLIRVNGDGLAPELYGVRVTNPDSQSFELAQFFVSFNPPAQTPAFQVVVPSRAEGYRLRSFPQHYNAGDLLAAIEAQLGGYNPSSVRVFVQNGGGYVDLGQLAGSPRDLAGRSFWILSRNGGPLSLSTPSVGLNAVGDRRIVILEPGWNMISMPATNPGNTSMDPNDISLFDDPLLTSGVGSLATAAGFETSVAHVFVDGSYLALNATDPLTAGVGYWLRNNTSGPLYLRYLPSDATLTVGTPLGTRAPRAMASGSAGAPDLPPPPPRAGLAEEDGGTSGCGLPGVELFALLALAYARGRRRSA